MKRWTEPYDSRNCAICYVPEAYGVQTENILGRQSAGREFLAAFARHSGCNDFLCVTSDVDAHRIFRGQIASFREAPFTTYDINVNDLYSLHHAGTVFWPDPLLGRLAWMRRSWRASAYSLCGITHTLSEGEVVVGLQSIVTDPVEPWDAIVCTSQIAKKTVKSIMEDWAHYYEDRFNAKIEPDFQTPVIPIGVDLPRFEKTSSKVEGGRSLRSRLCIPDDAVVGLYFGRLNFLSKSHPTPMFMAFEEAAQRLGDTPVHLIIVGQFNNSILKQEYEDLAGKFCARAKIHWLNGNDPFDSRDCWYAADYFISLSDNMQETFGMTVVEAMAAGLPCIVSEWSALKENIADARTGYVIPTTMPPQTVGAGHVRRSIFQIDSFSDTVASLSQTVGVDIRICAAAIEQMIADKDKRDEMGRQARHDAEQRFDWAKIIREYQDLWKNLEDIRQEAFRSSNIAKVSYPGQLNPFVVYGDFANHHISDNAQIIWVNENAEDLLDTLWQNISHLTIAFSLLPLKEIRKLITALAEDVPINLGAVADRHPLWDKEKLCFSLCWMLKYNLVGIGNDLSYEPHAWTVAG
ncbi:glycosyltransferase family 4 protein [Nitratireductor sp. XY-223]|uniref:glycosyltransferase family 4 protein n=1 Tax=Nitratireductor sp. XY-223 TaxID=2561926 RepID=UPI00145A8097|nr:glycosyltransferase family 4 protein [Nitratireductor sp. XY-223]